MEMKCMSPSSHVSKLRVYAHKNGNNTGKLCQPKEVYFSNEKLELFPLPFSSIYKV